MFDITSHLGNENQKQNNIIHYETTMKERGNERERERGKEGSVDKDMGKLESTSCTGGNVKWYSHLDNSMVGHEKTNNNITK